MTNEEYYDFKCRGCGEKFTDEFASANDVAFCKWCNGEMDNEDKCVGKCYLPVDKDLINLFHEFMEQEKDFMLPMIINSADGNGHIEVILTNTS